MYWLNYLDRNAIALSKLNGIQEDLNLSGSQYQTCVSILFVGYILGQIPSNMLLTRVRPSWYMAAAMALWAIVSLVSSQQRSKKNTDITLKHFDRNRQRLQGPFPHSLLSGTYRGSLRMHCPLPFSVLTKEFD